MKFKIFTAMLLLFAVIGVAFCASHTAESGVFIYQEVENYTLNGFNFTVPASYGLIFENETSLTFEGDNDTLIIDVIDGGEIQKVNSSGNISADETMFGSVEGYLVDDNGTYAFSYIEDGCLVRVSSKDMRLMMGVLGLD